MRGDEYYLMNQKQLTRYSVISMVIDGKLTNHEAAKKLGLSTRQIIRLKKGVIKEGPAFLIHKNKDRKPSHAFTEDFINHIVKLKKNELYKDANFKHFQELLEEHEDIKISYTPLYNILTKAGIKSPKKHRKPKKHHRRKRKDQEGLLIQIDATPFEWFGTDEKYALHGAIDDATGKVIALYLTKNECLQGYFEISRQILLNFGIPLSIYADRHTIFQSPNKNKLTVEEQLAGKTVNNTQFGRAMNEIGINLITARSPQAKGRIERLWNTLQSRLPTDLKIAGISSVNETNEFLVSYIPKFNKLFAVVPSDNNSAFRTITENIDIDNILSVKHTRVIDNGAVFSFYNKHFQVVCTNNLIPTKSKIDVLVSPRFGVRVQYNNTVYNTIPFIKPKKQNNTTNTQNNTRKKYIPPDDHYFKYGQKDWKKLTFEDTDQEILKMLENIFLSKYA